MKTFTSFVFIATMVVSCEDRSPNVQGADQKKIAALEAQLQQLKARSSSPTPDPKRPDKNDLAMKLNVFLASKMSRGIRDPEFIFPDTRETGNYSPELNAILQAGLIKNTPATHDKKYYTLAGTLRNVEKVPGVQFDLTGLGKKHYSRGTGPSKNTMGSYDVPVGIFNYGIYSVKEILSFTEPTAGFGATVTEVTYSYTCNTASWARNPSIMQAFPFVREDVERVFRDRKIFVLTNEGWRLEDRDR